MEISIWLGYACASAQWTEHCWCMRGDRIIESTAPFRIYYGAELTPEELVDFGNRFGDHDLTDRQRVRVWTFVDGYRDVVDYDPDVYANTIGRERDPNTREIKEGLGRQTHNAT